MNGRLHRAVDRLGRLPGVLQWRRRQFSKLFQAGRAIGCCQGLFASHAQAASACPTARPLGYDHAAGASMYRDRTHTVYPADYPMMLWLHNAFDDGVRKVFDLGGHVGVAYYAYQKLIPFPTDVTWSVHDVPAVMEAGRKEALQRDPTGQLVFVDSFDAAAEADLLFTSGCHQYLQDTLVQRLASLRQKPRWVLVNLLPLHPRYDYWTVQSIGTAFCPYHIQQSDAFFSTIEQLGYSRIDTWENLEKDCWIAFEPQHSLDRYFGAAFKLNTPTVQT